MVQDFDREILKHQINYLQYTGQVAIDLLQVGISNGVVLIDTNRVAHVFSLQY